MGGRDAADDWRRFPPGAIPSKDATPLLDGFLGEIRRQSPPSPPPTLLDVGCGTGRIAHRICDGGFAVVGVDINPAAIAAARSQAAAVVDPLRRPRFEVADFSTPRPQRIDGAPFDVVVCHLVLSIIGGVAEREHLLGNLHRHLRPGGWLHLSASGVSDSINAEYARLYAADLPLTGEPCSYLSRDDDGRILSMTHHFTGDELTGLLARAGFVEIGVTTRRESSSRRPEQAAFFHAVTCRRG